MNKKFKYNMQVSLNHMLKDICKANETEGKCMQRFWLLVLQYSAPAWLCTKSTQQLVTQLQITLSYICWMHAVVMFSMPSTSGNLYIIPIFAQSCYVVYPRCRGDLWRTPGWRLDDLATRTRILSISWTWSLFEAVFSFKFLSFLSRPVRRLKQL